MWSHCFLFIRIFSFDFRKRIQVSFFFEITSLHQYIFSYTFQYHSLNEIASYIFLDFEWLKDKYNRKWLVFTDYESPWTELKTTAAPLESQKFPRRKRRQNEAIHDSKSQQMPAKSCPRETWWTGSKNESAL